MAATSKTDQIRLNVEDALAYLARARNSSGVALELLVNMMTRVRKEATREMDYTILAELNDSYRAMNRAAEQLAMIEELFNALRDGRDKRAGPNGRKE